MPPGKAISPWCDGIVSGRLVKITETSPSTSTRGMSTAAATLPTRAGPEPAPEAAWRAATNVVERETPVVRVDVCQGRAGPAGTTADGGSAVVRRAGGMRPRYRCCETARLNTTAGRRAWTGTATLWESVTDAHADRVAIVQGERRTNLAGVRRPRRRLRASVAAAGLEPGAKVASYLYNGNEYLEGLYATFKMSGIAVNVNYRYPEDELVYLLDNSDAEALLFHSSLGDRVAKVRDRRRTSSSGSRSTTAARTPSFAVRSGRISTTEPMDRIALRRGHVLPLHRRHHGGAQGCDVALRRPVGCAGGRRTLFGRGQARTARRRRAARQADPRDARHRASSRVAAHARHGRSPPSVDVGWWSRHPRGPRTHASMEVAASGVARPPPIDGGTMHESGMVGSKKKRLS